MLECVQLCVLVTFLFATKKYPPNKSDFKRKEFIVDGSFRELQSIMAETTWHQKKDSSWSYYLQLGKQIEQEMLQKVTNKKRLQNLNTHSRDSLPLIRLHFLKVP